MVVQGVDTVLCGTVIGDLERRGGSIQILLGTEIFAFPCSVLKTSRHILYLGNLSSSTPNGEFIVSSSLRPKYFDAEQSMFNSFSQ